MIHDCMREIEAYYSQKKTDKRMRLIGMDEFLNLKDDDDAEDEERAARVRAKVVAREGDSAAAGGIDVTWQGIEAEVVDQTIGV